MEHTLQQLGQLLLGSIPTAIFLILVYGMYTVVVHKPLGRVLAERRSKTEGAIEKAKADTARAEARTAEYEQKLREARAALFKVQEARRQKSLQERSALVAEARARAQNQIAEARAAIEQEGKAAQANLQGEAGKIAAEIIRTVLSSASQAPAGAR